MAEIKIGGRLHSEATGNVVAGANEILDDNLNKKQDVINDEVNQHLNAPGSGLEDRVSTLEDELSFHGEIEVENTPAGVVTGSGKVTTANAVRGAMTLNGAGIFDISAYNASGDPLTLAKYATLALALAAVPDDAKKGGMSIKFVQSSDNKYVQYRFILSTFTTEQFVIEANWQGIKDNVVQDSQNLVTSSAVENRCVNTEYELRGDVTYRIVYNHIGSVTAKIGPLGLVSGNKYLLYFTLSSVKQFSIALSNAQAGSAADTLVIASTKIWPVGTHIISFVNNGDEYLRIGDSSVWSSLSDVKICNELDELVKDFGVVNTYTKGMPFIPAKFGKNLFYTKDLVIGANYKADGSVDTGSDVRRIQKTFIPIKPSTNYIFSTNGTSVAVGASYMYHCFYDADFKFISSVAASESTFQTPSNAAYVRLSMREGYYSDTTQLEEGITVTTFDVCNPLGIIADSFVAEQNNIDNAAILPVKTSFFDISKNLYDSSEGIDGHYIGVSTGNEGDGSSSLKVSGYIPVVQGKSYCCNNAPQSSQGYCFYDKNKQKYLGVLCLTR
jgi:hypothetical protein